MLQKSARLRPALMALPPLLITESQKEFDALHTAIERQIKPGDVIEEMFVDEIACIAWEIRRLRRCRAAIINMAFEPALEHLLARLPCLWRDSSYESGTQIDARDWFTDAEARKEILKLLGQYQLDESAIEAAAIQHSFRELESLDRMVTAFEARRNRALRCITEYRDTASRHHERANLTLSAKDVLRLEQASRKKTAA